MIASSLDGPHRHSAPVYTYLHLETDASVNMRSVRTTEAGSQEFFAGGGYVLRSISMRPVSNAGVPLGFVSNTQEAEARALLQGIRAAKAKGATFIRARMDSLRAMDAINSRAGGTSGVSDQTIAELLEEIGNLKAFQLLWTPSFHGLTRGDGVPTADILAREAAGLRRRKIRNRRHRR